MENGVTLALEYALHLFYSCVTIATEYCFASSMHGKDNFPWDGLRYLDFFSMI